MLVRFFRRAVAKIIARSIGRLRKPLFPTTPNPRYAPRAVEAPRLAAAFVPAVVGTGQVRSSPALAEDVGQDIAFDEEWYLKTNPDVARAVAAGTCVSGLAHYFVHGRAEGRLPAPAPPKTHKAAESGPELFSPYQSDNALLETVRVHTGMSASDLAKKFDSFGNDCEFGFVQRKCGAEVLGLFRFSNPSHRVILRGIESNFVGFGKNAIVELDSQKPRREWIVADRENGLRQHTYIWEGDQVEAIVQNQQLKRFRFLSEKMADNLADGSKILVIKSGNGDLSRDSVTMIARALRKRGPNWLLWVEPGDAVGRVDVPMEGLLHATIDRLTVQPNAPQFSLAGWLSVMSEAWITVEPLLSDDSPLRFGH
jgi:hypothetical protein